MMEQAEVRKRVERILENQKIGTLATVQGGKPYTRYMAFFNEGYTLYCATSGSSHKVDDIESNHSVHILLGYNGDGVGDEYVEIEADAIVSESPELKQQLWKDSFRAWLDGPDDPDYVVLEINPDKIYLKNVNKSDVYNVDL
ncbi:pyridoxamine 5'-phosphate oxidase family protein [Terribacillus sp. FSL K6-0262]|uniref:pyridoxamine 5'-phosphate oxidase family protein n=1 Tax=Terribacillus sp. FSL K6-0262 TaxID=2921447 RepID=UPI0030EB4984